MKVHFLGCPVLLSLLGAMLLSPGCGPSRDDPSRSAGEAAFHVVPVETAVAGRAPLTVTRVYTGSLEGEEQANVVSKISERITSIKAAVGDRVRKGETLVGLDRRGTSSQFYQAEAGYRNAAKSLERMKSLYAEGAVALQSLDGAQTAYDVARANFEAAQSAVDLSTPIAGAVTAVNVSLGDLTAPGQVLMTVANIDRMKVTVSMNENDVANVALGQQPVIYSEARPDLKVKGKIIQISKSADVRSRSFDVKAIFPNSQGRWFRPGMFVKVTLSISPRGTPLTVPASALLSDGTTTRVFVIRGGRSYQVRVLVGMTDGERTVILEGLAEGDTVATVGVNNLKDSCLVAVANR
jgi:RND family efflux transporter MFP subunit